MIQVIQRFHTILEYISSAGDSGATIKELAELLSVSQPACANIIRTMVKLGYLVSLPEKRGYIIGAMPSFISRNGPFKGYILTAAKSEIDALVERINEYCVLVANCSGMRAMIYEKQGLQPIMVSPGIANMSPLADTSTGMLMLAHLNEQELGKYISGFGVPDKFDDEAQFKDALAKIKQDGWHGAIPSDKEDLNAAATLAFPIMKDGKLDAALGLKIPMFRFPAKKRKIVMQECLATVERISARL